MAEFDLHIDQAKSFFAELDEAVYASLCDREGSVVAQIDYRPMSVTLFCEGYFIPHVFSRRIAELARRSWWCDRMHMWS